MVWGSGQVAVSAGAWLLGETTRILVAVKIGSVLNAEFEQRADDSEDRAGRDDGVGAGLVLRQVWVEVVAVLAVVGQAGQAILPGEDDGVAERRRAQEPRDLGAAAIVDAEARRERDAAGRRRRGVVEKRGELDRVAGSDGDTRVVRRTDRRLLVRRSTPPRRDDRPSERNPEKRLPKAHAIPLCCKDEGRREVSHRN